MTLSPKIDIVRFVEPSTDNPKSEIDKLKEYMDLVVESNRLFHEALSKVLADKPLHDTSRWVDE